MSDEASELLELTRALRAHAEWQRATGVMALPRATRADLDARGGPPPEFEPGARGAAARRSDPSPARAAPAPSRAAPGSSHDAPAPSRAAPGSSHVAPAPSRAVAPESYAAEALEQVRAAATRGESMPPDLVSVAPPRVVLPVAERSAALSSLQAEVAACEACGLHATRTQTVFARGQGTVGVCFVGEGPGADEDAQGLPFVGKAGQLLDKMIGAMGLDRDEVYIANIVKCRPPKNRKPEVDEMSACVGYLRRQLDLVQPEVIVALGATAVQGLLGTSQGITRMRGNWKLYEGRIAVMPTFHPAYLLRSPAAKREVWEDLKAVLRHLGRPVPGAKTT